MDQNDRLALPDVQIGHVLAIHLKGVDGNPLKESGEEKSKPS